MPKDNPQQALDADVDATKINRFAFSFKQQLATTMNQRISREVSLINRRLDALARLLETNQICVAIRYNATDQSLVISSNAIHQTSKETNQYISNISNMMMLLADHDASISEIIDKLSKYIAINFYQEKRFELAGTTLEALRQKVKNQLVELYKSGKQTKDWEQDTVCDDSLDESLLKHTSRLARDFLKLRKSIHNLSHATGEGAAILKAMRDNKTTLIKTGGKDEHAEMRQVYSIQDTPQKPYIGISKLCCARCALTVKVMDVPTRGNHGRLFNRWGIPGFFQSNPATFSKFLGASAIDHALLTPKEKMLANEHIVDGKKLSRGKDSKLRMMPDTSSSDEVFGVSDDSADPDELDLTEIFEAMDIKDKNQKAYEGLKNTGQSIRKILSYADTPEKLAKFSSPKAVQLVQDGECEYDDLESIYNESVILLDYVLADEENLIEDAGFNDAVHYYRKALQKSIEFEDDEACYEFDVGATARADYLEENGWDYDENEEDSDNRFGYRSS